MKKILFAAAALLIFASCGPKALKSGLDPVNFASEYNGKPTALYTLTNKAGMEVSITNFGGRIVSVMVPDSDGNFKDVVLGFDKVSDYFPENNQSDFGAAIGRFANRIGNAKFEIDGNEYQLPRNNAMHCLHGGPTGWQYQVYEAVEADSKHVKLQIVSPDGDNNFPGEVTATVTYTLTEENAIDIVYEAETTAPTVINMTNHSYFNLSGDPANHCICEDYMGINSSSYTPTDRFLIPTGEIASVENTPLDFRCVTKIGDRIDDNSFEAIAFAGGYDHNWILDTNCSDTLAAAVLFCPESGIIMTEYTNEPGVQVYSGNFLNGTLTGKNGIVYNKRAGICLETQHFPDSPNKPEWPSTVLRPGEKYYSHCIFAFSTVKSCEQRCEYYSESDCEKHGNDAECKGDCEKHGKDAECKGDCEKHGKDAECKGDCEKHGNDAECKGDCEKHNKK